jgi:hypothetical protein
MAQTGFTPIQLYFSSTTTNVPLAANLASGELAINITDGKLFYKDNANAVQVIGWKVVPTTAGGTGLTSYTAGDLPYYASGTTLSKLGIGAANTVLTSSGTAPQWSTNLNIGSLTATSINNSGNLTFTSTAQKITGDFSNGTWANRVAFQTTTTNGATRLTVVPNGTGTVTALNLHANIDVANASVLNINMIDASEAQINSNKSGTGTYLPLGIYTNNTKQINVATSGDVTVSTGNIVQGTAAKGINFTANTPAAGMTSQLLNWYEQGTFTPVAQGSSTAGTATYSTQTGQYTRIGNRVLFNLRIIYTGGTGTGNMRVGGLPFTSNSAMAGAVVNIYAENLAGTALYIFAGQVAPNATYIGIDQVPVGGGAAIALAYDGAADIALSGHYFV